MFELLSLKQLQKMSELLSKTFWVLITRSTHSIHPNRPRWISAKSARDLISQISECEDNELVRI